MSKHQTMLGLGKFQGQVYNSECGFVDLNEPTYCPFLGGGNEEWTPDSESDSEEEVDSLTNYTSDEE